MGDSTATVIQANPGETVIEFYCRTTERRPVSDTELLMAETPIVGWRCHETGWSDPITVEPWNYRGEGAANAFFYRTSDGRFRAKSGRFYFDSLDDTRKAALQMIQSQFD